MIKILDFSEEKEWLNRLLTDFMAHARESVRVRSVCHVALSGGSTPKSFYQSINASRPLPDPIEWWIGDERWVAPTHAESNERMIRESLGINWPDLPLHSWHTADRPAKAAENYDRLLVRKMGSPPVFDLCLLGVGTDGHTASLFPGTGALQESLRYAADNTVPQLNAIRLTLTFPVLDNARKVWFLIKGREKEEMVLRLQARDSSIPSACINNPNQCIYWLAT